MKYRTIECCTPWVLPTEVLLIAYKKYIPGPRDLKVHIDILMGYIYMYQFLFIEENWYFCAYLIFVFQNYANVQSIEKTLSSTCMHAENIL